MSAKNWASKGHKKEITVTVPHWWKNGTTAVASIILALLSLMIIGCQLGPGEQPASTPLPTAAPLPPPTSTLEERRMPVGVKNVKGGATMDHRGGEKLCLSHKSC